MSIAVSVVVRPSRLLLTAVAAMCAAVSAIGVLIASASIGELAVTTRFVLALSCLFLAFFGFYHTVRNRKAHHIDISGNGQIRLGEAGARNASCQERNRPHLSDLNEGAQAVRLLKDSTIWPGMLLLRLQAADERVTVVPILPDCVSRDEFRALSVACRWCATHSESEHGKANA